MNGIPCSKPPPPPPTPPKFIGCDVGGSKSKSMFTPFKVLLCAELIFIAVLCVFIDATGCCLDTGGFTRIGLDLCVEVSRSICGGKFGLGDPVFSSWGTSGTTGCGRLCLRRLVLPASTWPV